MSDHPLLTEDEIADLVEIRRLLDEAYRHYFQYSDGHCKSAEGEISVDFGTFFERRDWHPARCEPTVRIYSYVLGPSRMHYFRSIREALHAVKGWHAHEMNHDDYSDEDMGGDDE